MELTANELRIGNLVNALLYGDEPINIESICSLNNEIFNSITGEIPLISIKPIPLTEEWLLKFGFEINDDLGDEIYYQIPEEKNGYGICFDHNDITFYKYYGNGAENVHTLIYDEKHLQSVHQLQNIYFSLTNTELKLIK